MNGNSRIVLIGTGFVGMSYAYALVNQGGPVEELVLIDINKDKAIGEAMDLNHGLAFSPKKMNIWAGDYEDCATADLVVISAGANQKPGETRLDLIEKNDKIFESIVSQVVATGFDGIFLVATNPVDIMTYVTWKYSNFPKERVIGSGTTLDSARLMYMLGDYLKVNPKNINAYVMGEHGDTEFVPWSHVTVGVKPIFDALISLDKNAEVLNEIYEDVRDSAYDIIRRKQATYYGIGLALTRITNAILHDENSILTVSSYLDGQYGMEDVFIGVPSIINNTGVQKVIELNLMATEQEKFEHSVNTLKEAIETIKK